MKTYSALAIKIPAMICVPRAAESRMKAFPFGGTPSQQQAQKTIYLSLVVVDLNQRWLTKFNDSTVKQTNRQQNSNP